MNSKENVFGERLKMLRSIKEKKNPLKRSLH